MNTNTNSNIPSFYEVSSEYAALTYDLRKSRKRLTRRDADMHFAREEARAVLREYKIV